MLVSKFDQQLNNFVNIRISQAVVTANKETVLHNCIRSRERPAALLWELLCVDWVSQNVSCHCNSCLNIVRLEEFNDLHSVVALERESKEKSIIINVRENVVFRGNRIGFEEIEITEDGR